MEAFSLLKFWKSSSAGVPAANTILAAVSDDDDGAGDPPAAGDDGPFFDLEFAGPDSDDECDENSLAELVCLEADGGDGDGGEAVECGPDDILKFRVSSSGSERSDPNLPVSPSDDVFFRGKLVAVEAGSDPNSVKPQLFPVALVRSATRLRILMSGFKRSSRPAQAQAQPDPKQSKQPQRKKLFTVKFKAGEVPIVSLFTRDHSARPLNGVVSSLSSSSSTSSSSSSSSSSAKQPPSPSPSPKPKDGESEQQQPAPPPADEKRNSKDGVQKYFKMVKPLYIRVSKRYGEKLSGLSSGSAASPVVETPPAAEDKATENQDSAKESSQKMQGSLGVGLKVMMRKRLSGKSKSADAGVVHPAAPAAVGGRQRDDSLVQQQEWIQGAILHCKRSFNASRDDEPASVLSRSASDPTHEKTVNNTSSSSEQNDVVGGG